ncbi:hypothetical protein P3T76_012254 [Phytophthora citrophthora]|uniref:RxLR effector protein n=1 Tax=Phytophthora citrophthora TaxID=4793 RepID=A0AAD9G5L8_9STRA|nr:hypothetical protein P3T76_012254 [Phytophthora citrophthora]
MQLSKVLFIAAALCVAAVSAGNAHQHEQEQEEQNGNQEQVESASDSTSGSGTPSPVQKGFDVQQVKFSSSDPNEEKGENAESSSTPLFAGLGAAACVGVVATVYYVKRRNEEDKLPGEIFTIDDKNSVL